MNKRHKILVVDDERVNIRLISSALKDSYDIVTALNGHDAISQLKEHTPDLILLDAMMPDINGFEVCKIIKANTVYSDIPVIFLSALDTHDAIRHGLNAGGIDYLVKPVDLDLLKLRVRNHLDLKERNALIKEQRDLLVLQKKELEFINEQLRSTRTELRRSRNQLSDVIDFLPDATLAINKEGRVIIWNRAIEKMTGVPAAEMLGKKDNAYTIPFHGEVRPNLMDLVLGNSEQAGVCYPKVTRTGDALMGEVFCKSLYKNKGAWVFAKASPLHDDSGNIAGVIESIRDITELKQAEMELREANQFSEQIINSAQEGVIVYDLNLRYRVWNPFMEQMSGMAADKVLGKHPSELFPFVEASGMIERLEKVLAGDLPTTMDFPYSVPETGKTGWNSDLSVPLRDADGKIIGVIATIRETTWRKRILDELQNALEETKSANSTMSRLLRTLAHEFRTPLGLLIGCTDIIDRYWDRMTPEKRSQQNEHIQSAARQLSTMLNSIIMFIQAGTSIPSKSLDLLNIEEFCQSIAAEIVQVWGAKHVFDVTIDPNCGIILLDKTLFRRILENLLTNSFRYTPPGGYVSLYLHRENNRLHLKISDKGIGIPEEDLTMLFDAFYRCQNIGDRRGLGLGLSIVQESLVLIGGTISLNSKIGEGTTIRVEIPIDNNLSGNKEITSCTPY